MAQGFLLGRALLRFDHGTADRDPGDLLGELSAAAFSPDGSLWLGADEGLTLTRHLDEPALLVVYDDPAPERRTADHAVLMDLYRLPR